MKRLFLCLLLIASLCGVADTAVVQQARDQYGFIVENTPMGEGRSVEPVRLNGATFVGTTIDPNFWTTTAEAGASVTQASAEAILWTGILANGTATLETIARARYTGGSANRFRGQVQLSDSGVENNLRRWGCWDGTNGAYFKLNGTTLECVTIKGSVESSAIPSSSWNKSTSVPNLTLCNSYEIYFTNTKVFFVIGDVLKHAQSFTSGTTWTENTNLKIRLDNINTNGSSTGAFLRCRVATIYRLGKLETSPRYKNISTATTTVLKYGAGILHKIVINNPTNNTITVYDNTAASGAKIATIDPDSSATPFTLDYMASFSEGLTIVTAGTADITIVYE